MLFNKWTRLAIGATGAVVALGAYTMMGSGQQVTQLTAGTSSQSALLAQNPVLHVAVDRMQDYKSGDPGAFSGLVESLLSLLAINPNLTSMKTLRQAEGHTQVVKRCIAKLRRATSKRTNNHSSVMEEFDTLSGTVVGVCDDTMFNLNQSYTVG